MTCIANYATKKAFRESVEKDNANNTESVSISDPSIVRPYEGRLNRHPDLQNPGGFITVTNHPQRKWFASVERMKDGRLKVQ